MNINKVKVLVGIILSGLAAPFFTRAFCPVCVPTAAALLGVSRWTGIDDMITGVWIGALLLSLTALTHNWLSKKNINLVFSELIWFTVWYGLTLIPLWYLGIIGHEANLFYGWDRLILGTLIGTVISLIMVNVHEGLKKINHDQHYFPYQRLIIVFSGLIATCLILYFFIL